MNKGLWQAPEGTIEVAVKTLQPQASDMDRVKFLQEAAIMGQFLHPNVVKLHGVVTVGEPVSVCVWLCVCVSVCVLYVCVCCRRTPVSVELNAHCGNRYSLIQVEHPNGDSESTYM